MVRSENGIVVMKGMKVDIFAEVSTLLHEFKNKFGQKDFDFVVQQANMTEEEIAKRANDIDEKAKKEIEKIEKFRQAIKELMED